MKKSLILTVGLPRSGKSTWARQQGFPVVSPDAIRLALHGKRFLASEEPAVWKMACLMVDALFKAGNETVIVDATNITEKRRAAWKERFGPESALAGDVFLHVVTTPPDECIRRAQEEQDAEIIPVIERMAQEWDLDKPWEESNGC
ncbi:MAG: ATP-binding protein [Nitrospirae bacterium]|nr:ATP-binding protein [Nitrospirota bacterium]